MRRSPSRTGPRRVLAVAAFAVVVLLPGVAQAAPVPGLPTPPPDPLGSVTGAVGGALGAGGAQDTGSAASPSTAGQPALPGGPPAPPPLDPSQLQQLLQQLQISPDCVNGVLKDVQVIVGDLPEPLGSQLSGLVAQLQQGPGSLGQPTPLPVAQPGGTTAFTLPAPRPGSPSGTGALALSPSDPQNSPLPGDVQNLLKDFAYNCLPQPPSLPAAGSSGTPPSSGAPAASPASTPQQPQQPQPVTYPGYAPTGGPGPAGPPEGDRLALLAEALLLLASAGTAGYGVRRHAAHARG